MLRNGPSSASLLRHQINQTTQMTQVENRAPNPSGTSKPPNPNPTGLLEAQQNGIQTDQSHNVQQLYLYRHKSSEGPVRMTLKNVRIRCAQNLTSGCFVLFRNLFNPASPSVKCSLGKNSFVQNIKRVHPKETVIKMQRSSLELKAVQTPSVQV